MAPFDLKIVKTKDVSKGENLFEMPKDEGFNFPSISIDQEKSTILIESSQLVNVGTTRAP